MGVCAVASVGRLLPCNVAAALCSPSGPTFAMPAEAAARATAGRCAIICAAPSTGSGGAGGSPGPGSGLPAAGPTVFFVNSTPVEARRLVQARASRPSVLPAFGLISPFSLAPPSGPACS